MEETNGVDSGSSGPGWGWTRTHRVGIALLICVLVALLIVQYLRRPILLDTLRVEPSTEAAAGLIDPNTATEAELASLPKIGPTLAGRIVAYRAAVMAENPGQRVFVRLSDLRQVQGIGKKLVEAVKGYVDLPDEAEGAGTEGAATEAAAATESAATEPVGN